MENPACGTGKIRFMDARMDREESKSLENSVETLQSRVVKTVITQICT